MVFSTKNREPYLSSREIRRQVFQHIRENALEKKIRLEGINGYDDHVHCLLYLDKEQSISEVAHLIKGESSRWINTAEMIPGSFAWQDDYWAVSIGESELDRIRKYIANQEEHHSQQSFSNEMHDFSEEYGWNYFLEDINE